MGVAMPPAGLDAAAGNVPPQLTRFFGREADVAELERLLESNRLVSLVGPGGVGKTRLAVEAAQRLGSRHPGGSWLVELAPLNDGALVPEAVATVLGCPDQPGRPRLLTLLDELAATELLLVLDNCEHVVEEAARLCASLLMACPGVHMLATGRSSLDVPGEHVWRVPPLPLDVSVRLFADRAGRAGTGFRLTGANQPDVERICQRLAGIPLAVELAAARTRSVSLRMIGERLDGALQLLTDGPRTVTDRQRTMRATLDWDYELLTGPQRALLARLSVFAGGWDLEAAEAVGFGFEVSPGEVVDVLSDLVDHSLVMAEPEADGDMRYRLLEPVRQYAHERLEVCGESTAIGRRHAEHFLTLAVTADRQLRGGDQVRWLHRVSSEWDNFRVALQWSIGQESDIGLRLATALARAFWLRGSVTEGRGWLAEQLGTHAGDERLCASAQLRTARLEWWQRDYELAWSHAQESLAILRRLGDAPAAARRQSLLGVIAVSRGELQLGAELLEACLPLLRAEGDEHGVAYALLWRAIASYMSGDGEWAEVRLRESLDISTRLGNRIGMVNPLAQLVFIAIDQGRLDVARARAAQLGELVRGFGSTLQLPMSVWPFVRLAAAEDRPRAALRLAGFAAARERATGLGINELERARWQPAVDRLRTVLAAGEADGLLAEGAAMAIEQALEEALGGCVPAEPAGPDRFGLSPREWEVASLVAEGLSNGEIARRLYISPRTAESHVGHVLDKLTLQNRTQLAAWMADHRRGAPGGRDVQR